jgi:hypothetical protein
VSGGLDWRIESSIDCIAALETQWSRVHSSDHTATVFQSHTWVMHWLNAYDAFVESPWILLCYDHSTIVGIAPLYTRLLSRFGFSVRALAFLGTGEPEHCESYAEYMDVICAEDYRDRCTDCLQEAMLQAEGVQVLEFLRVFQPRVDEMTRRLKSSFTKHSDSDVGARFCKRISTFPELTSSNKEYGSLRRKRRRFNELPDAQVVWAKDEPTRQRLYQSLTKLHEQRWQREGKSGVFSSSTFSLFQNGLSQDLLIQGKLLLFSLEVGGKPVAVHYCFLDKESCYFYQSGVDFDAYPQVSVGAIAHLVAMDYCGREGLKAYDLMGGHRDSYKRRFADPGVPLVNHRRFKSTVAMLFFRSLLA